MILLSTLLLIMKKLKEFVIESENDDIESRLDAMLGDEEVEEQPENTALNIGLVSDTILYSRQDQDFIDRRDSIIEAFSRLLKFQEITSDRIASTLIFDIFVKHLMQQYKKNVNENVIYNIATENEIKRILANEFNIKLRGYNIS